MPNEDHKKSSVNIYVFFLSMLDMIMIRPTFFHASWFRINYVKSMTPKRKLPKRSYRYLFAALLSLLCVANEDIVILQQCFVLLQCHGKVCRAHF